MVFTSGVNENIVLLRRTSMREFNHWRERQEEIKRRAAEDRAVLYTIIIGVFILLWII